MNFTSVSLPLDVYYELTKLSTFKSPLNLHEVFVLKIGSFSLSPRYNNLLFLKLYPVILLGWLATGVLQRQPHHQNPLLTELDLSFFFSVDNSTACSVKPDKPFNP